MMILIIDNSTLIIERLVDFISDAQETATFYKAASYNEAIDRLNECKPDIMILDWNLPGNKAITLVEKARQVNDKTVVIILSNFITEHTKQQCKNIQADFLFDKYYEFEKLPELISNMHFREGKKYSTGHS